MTFISWKELPVGMTYTEVNMQIKQADTPAPSSVHVLITDEDAMRLREKEQDNGEEQQP